MTLKDLMAADVSRVFLNTSDFAETITHRSGGVAANDTPVTVDFQPVEGAGGNMKDHSLGEARVSKAVISAATSLGVAADDVFIRGTEVWSVETVAPDNFGMQLVNVVRVDEDRTSRMRSRR